MLLLRLAALAGALAASCFLSRSGLREGDSELPADSSTDGDGDGDGDGDEADADGDAARPDADGPPPVPVGPIDLPPCGRNGAHPAVLWTGVDFAVAHVVRQGAAQRVELFRVRPGELPDGSSVTVTIDGTATYEDVSLASDGRRLAVGWLAGTLGLWSASLRVLPGGFVAFPVPGVERQGDRDDAHATIDVAGVGLIVRGAELGNEALYFGTVDPLGLPDVVARASGGFGELSARAIRAGTVVVAGGSKTLHLRRDGRWSRLEVSGLGTGSEGDAVELDGETLLTVWLHDEDTGVGRILSAVTLSPEGDGYSQRGDPLELPFRGSDPALATTGDRVVLAMTYSPEPSTRSLGLVPLAADGAALAEPCAIPGVSGLGSANEPDVACGGGHCAVVWMEGSSYSADDFITRLAQVPESDLGALCE